MNVYVLRFEDGTYRGSSSWARVSELKRAKKYSTIGAAKAAISYHRYKNVEVVTFELVEVK